MSFQGIETSAFWCKTMPDIIKRMRLLGPKEEKKRLMMLWLNKTMASNPLADRSKGLWLYNKRVGSWAGRRGNKQSAAEKQVAAGADEASVRTGNSSDRTERRKRETMKKQQKKLLRWRGDGDEEKKGGKGEKNE